MASFSSVLELAKGTMLITVIGFLSVLSVFALVTLLSYGILPKAEFAGVAQPSMASNAKGAPVAALVMAAGPILKLTATCETYETGKSRSRHGHRGDKLLLSCIHYAPGAILYVIARLERNLRLFRPAEAVLFGIIVLGTIAGVVSLANGAIEI